MGTVRKYNGVSDFQGKHRQLAWCCGLDKQHKRSVHCMAVTAPLNSRKLLLESCKAISGKRQTYSKQRVFDQRPTH